GHPTRASRLEVRDVLFVAERQGDIVKTFNQTPPRVVINHERHRYIPHGYRAVYEADGQFDSGLSVHRGPQRFDVCFADLGRKQALLARVPSEDIGKTCRYDDL